MHAAGAKYPSKIIWPLLLASLLLLLGACENDLKKIQEISGSHINLLVDTVHGVDVIYSDSAKVKARMLAPIMLQTQGKDPYNEMPHGVNLIFYDKDLVQEGTLKSDYAIRHDNTKTTIFRKNVVATNAKGETFTSDELIWDEAAKQMHSDKVMQIRMADGDIINGTGFQSDQGLEHWTVKNSTGVFNVTDSLGQ
jgi:hypothetical protein